MGRVAAPYGVRGWVKVQPFTQAPDTLLAHRTWWIADKPGTPPRSRVVEESRLHSDVVIAKLEGIGTREEALLYRGREIAVPRDALPPIADDEVYLADLVGLQVVNRRGEQLGRVDGTSDDAAQPILRVVAEGGIERLVPFGVVDEVDLEAGRIVVDWEADY
jgi:16S rRNA processing protein RimM